MGGYSSTGFSRKNSAGSFQLSRLWVLGFCLWVSVGSLSALDRQFWDGGKVPRNPAQGPWRLEEAFPTLQSIPGILGFAVPPGETNRIILVGMGGSAFEVSLSSAPKSRLFLDLSERVFFEQESGLLGMAFHPSFQTNGWVFVYYCSKEGAGGLTQSFNRLSRFTVPPGGNGLPDPASEVVLFHQEDPGPNHNAGCLAFGPDGYLYLSVGDGSLSANRVVQRLDAGFFGGILRIDVDRRPGNLRPNPGFGVNPAAYSIPADNPFVGIRQYQVGKQTVWNGANPESLRTEFYALGMRNPWQFSFDSKTGELWCNDVGFGSREEVNRIRPGANYGWPWWEGTLSFANPPVEGMASPEFEYSHFSGRTAITGSRFYRGAFYPELDGTYLFADWSGDIALLRPGQSSEAEVTWIANMPGVIAFGSDPRDGSLLMTSGSGRILRLVHRPELGEVWPERLSETGLFENVQSLTPRPGLVPYEINAPFWSDYALKRRWFALPGDDSTMTFRREGPWTFPMGTVWVKHFDRPYYRPNTLLFPMETRILIQTTNGVSGASYRWNDAGTDADLVPADGANAMFYAWTPTDLVTQNWRFPARNECLSCHNSANGGPAGFNTAQLNRVVRHGVQILSQLNDWSAAGYFSRPLVRTHQMPALVAPSDETQTLERRVRAYLDSNCASCHQPGGLTRMPWDARIGTALDQMGLIGVRSSASGLGSGDYLIDPGHPENSSLYLRISTLGALHMPPLGSSEIHREGVDLLRRWIVDELPGRQGYTQWATQWMPEPWEGLRLQAMDPDGDGLDNFTEYLLREGPLSPKRLWKPSLLRHGSQFVLRFPRWAGRRFEVQWASDMTPTAQWSRLEVEENDPRAKSVDSEASIPLPDGPTRFYRVTVAGD
jgi:uncharacterized repeat protein (TIGR03806 family)